MWPSPARSWLGNCCGLGGSHTPCLTQTPALQRRSVFCRLYSRQSARCFPGYSPPEERGQGLAPVDIPQSIPRSSGCYPGDAECSGRGRCAGRCDHPTAREPLIPSLPPSPPASNTPTRPTHTHAQAHLWKLHKPNANLATCLFMIFHSFP